MQSCKKSEENLAAPKAQMMSLELAPPDIKNKNKSSTKLTKSGEITITSNDIDVSKKLISSLITKCKGNLNKENLIKNDYQMYYDLNAYVEANEFDKFFFLIDSCQLNIVAKSLNISDVTMQYVEDSTILHNNRILESKYISLLSKTNVIQDLLDIEDKLREIRTDIELYESRMKYLNNSINFSAISIKIEKTGIFPKNNFTDQVSNGFVNGWEYLKSSILFVITLWPFAIILTILIFIIKRIRKNRRNKKVS